MAEYAIGALDENGFLTESDEAIAAATNVTRRRRGHRARGDARASSRSASARGTWRRACWPRSPTWRRPGEAGRARPSPPPSCAITWPDLGERRFAPIASALGSTQDEVHRRLGVRQGQPASVPDVSLLGGGRAGSQGRTIVRPDVLIRAVDGELHGRGGRVAPLRAARRPHLCPPVSRDAQRSEATESDRQHVREYVGRARFFIDNVNRRRATLQRIAECLVDRQRDYLLHGVQHLVPLTRAEVGALIGMHESTVSRATAEKFVMLPTGEVVPFGHFFTASLGVKDQIRKMIEAEEVESAALRPGDRRPAGGRGRGHRPAHGRQVPGRAPAPSRPPSPAISRRGGSVRGASLRTLGRVRHRARGPGRDPVRRHHRRLRVPPTVERIGLTHHLSADDGVALTTTSIEVVFSRGRRPCHRGGRLLRSTPSGRRRLQLERRDPDLHARLTGCRWRPTSWCAVAPGVRDAAGNVMASRMRARLRHRRPSHRRRQPAGAERRRRAARRADRAAILDADGHGLGRGRRCSITPEIELTPTWSGEVLTLTPAEPLAEGARYTLRLIGTDARDSAGTPLERSPTPQLPGGRAPACRRQTPLAGGRARRASRPARRSRWCSTATLDPDTLDPRQVLHRAERPRLAGRGRGARVRPACAEPGRGCCASCHRPRCRPNTTYRVTLAAGLAGTDGAAMAAPITWRFTTGAPLASLSNQIVFLTDRGGIDNLWAMNPDGTGPAPASLRARRRSPATRSRRTAAASSSAMARLLVRQQADGGGRQIADPGWRAGGRPAFAPDGTRDRLRAASTPLTGERAGPLDPAGLGRRRPPGRAARRAGRQPADAGCPGRC